MKFLKALGPFLRGAKAMDIARPPAARYQIFSTQFDAIAYSHELDPVIGFTTSVQDTDQSEAWDTFSGAMQGWRTKAHVSALNASAEIRATKPPEALQRTVVTILVDHSGSMAGQKILLAAAACDVTMDFLDLLGVQSEILGFTTVNWQGGKSRQLWKRRGAPPEPGRLADILHVIYKSAKVPKGWGRRDLFKPMLRRDLLKENIDGEAIEWAIARQMAIDADRRIIVVLSDGRPVDDSTLTENGAGYLARHLEDVIAKSEDDGVVELIGVGIGFDTSQFYKTSAVVNDISDLGTTLIGTLSSALQR